MIKQCLQLWRRNLRRDKFNSFVTFIGTSIGVAATLIILIWIINEVSYDRFHSNRENIYRITYQNVDTPDKFIANSSFALAPMLFDNFPEINAYTRLHTRWGGSVKSNTADYYEKGFIFADSNFFNVFSFPFLQGNSKDALRDRNSIVITESTARKYFGNKNPIGLELIRDDRNKFVVTGVIKDIPKNSSIQFDLVTRIEFLPQKSLNDLQDIMDQSYLILNKNTNPELLSKKIISFYNNRYKTISNGEPPRWQPQLQPLSKVHLYSKGNTGLIVYIRILGVIAILILCLTVVNFVNVTTIKSFKYAKEVGIKKTFGVKRRTLFTHFFIHSLLNLTICFILGFGVVLLLYPHLNNMLHIDISINNIDFLSIAAFFIVLSLLSCSYPSFVLSSSRPIGLFKEHVKSGKGKRVFQTTIITVQLILALSFVLSYVFTAKQISYLLNKPLGYSKENIITIPIHRGLRSQFTGATNYFKQELLKNENIISVTASSNLLYDNSVSVISVDWEGKLNTNERTAFSYIAVDKDYWESLGLELMEGNSFSDNAELANHEFLINETAASIIGEQVLGKRFTFSSGLETYKREGNIIGVVKDFNFRTLHENIQPLILTHRTTWFQYIHIRVNDSEIPEVISFIKEVHKSFLPHADFSYSIQENDISLTYNNEQIMKEIFKLALFVAVIISILGIFSVVLLTVKQRKKEIAIRNVLGSSQLSIVSTISSLYLKITVAAIVISSLISYVAISNWLKGFAYSVSLQPSVFIITGMVTFLIIFSILYKTIINSCQENPVNVLRNE